MKNFLQLLLTFFIIVSLQNMTCEVCDSEMLKVLEIALSLQSGVVSEAQHLHLHLQIDLALSFLLFYLIALPLFSVSPSVIGIWADN